MRNFQKEDNILIIMCGLPASGKSTLAKNISRKSGIKICCMDDIREKVLGDVGCQSDGAKIYRIMEKHVKRELKHGDSVIIDCTNITPSGRRKFLRDFYGLYKKSCCIFLNTPYEDCLARNNNRKNKIVPLDRMESFKKKLIVPSIEEGYTYLEII